MGTGGRVAAVIDLGDFFAPGMQYAAAKYAQRQLGGQPLVVRIARRLSESTLIDRAILAGSNLPVSLLTSGIAGVEAVNMPSCHPCERLGAAAVAAGAEWVVHIPANRPFIDPSLIDPLIAEALRSGECDYVGYASGTGDRRRAVRLTLAGEACHVDALRRLRPNVDQLPEDCLSVASWLENAPGAFHLNFIEVPSGLDRSDLRFSVEDEADWARAERLWRSVGDERCPWQTLMQRLSEHDWAAPAATGARSTRKLEPGQSS